MHVCASCGGLTPVGTSPTCLHCDADLRPRWWWRMPAILGPVGAILLAACYGAPGRYYRMDDRRNDQPTRLDSDGDGARGPWVCVDPQYRAQCEPQLKTMPPLQDLDCDDHDATRYPGAADPDGDGIDQNCDGVDGWAQPNIKATP